MNIFFSLRSDDGESPRGPKKWELGDVSTHTHQLFPIRTNEAHILKRPVQRRGPACRLPSHSRSLSRTKPQPPLASNPAPRQRKKKEGN